MGDKKGNGGFALLCCFIALGVSAVIAFITYLLPIVSDVTVGVNVMNILDIVLSVVTLLGLAFGAFAFAGRHGRAAARGGSAKTGGAAARPRGGSDGGGGKNRAAGG